MRSAQKAAALLALAVVPACLWIIRPGGPFEEYDRPPAPNYDQLDSWAAHPDKKDASDVDPPGWKDSRVGPDAWRQGADVFFIHPTTAYTRANWNADLADATINERTDRTMQLQASAFRGATRVFAPRYRQATLYAFVDQTGSGKKALDLAYADVKRAFEIYMMRWNRGRPIIVAGHSQGSGHGQRLVADVFDDQPLSKNLVAAYLIGATLPPASFKMIGPCGHAAATGCWISWNTFDENEQPRLYKERFEKALCINPLNWEASGAAAPKELNDGGVPTDFSRLDEAITGARCDGGILRVAPIRTDGYPKAIGGGYHTMDYQFFYGPVRRNVWERIQSFHAR